MKSQAYLREIRQAAGLSRAVLKKITVEGGEAVFYLVTDVNYTEEDAAYAAEVSARYAAGLKASVRIMKSVPSEEGIKNAVRDILGANFPAFSAFVAEGGVSVSLGTAGGAFTIEAGGAERNKEKEAEVLDAVSAALNRSFCGNRVGELRFTERAEGISRELPPEEFVFTPRYFDVADYGPIDGGEQKRAIYIADLSKEMQGVTVCGSITYIAERATKTGKPYFSVSLSDGTGTLRLSYFTKVKTVEKVRGLRQGMYVCFKGDNELFNGALSFRSTTVDFGRPPEGFVPEERPSRPVPAQYQAVFPVPEEDLVQGTLFGGDALPADFLKENFVVFDLETTGLSTSGVMDRIIEVGAVKITGGRISERFSTFVACPTKLPPEIVALTGITDDMLVGAPPIGAVVADFYKFAAGCSLVAHNTQFDCKLISYYGGQEGYSFNRRQFDTVFLAQELLHLKNYKLNTVAEYFGFEFNHHRAFDDAFVTAKIFIELIRMRKGLPG